ncbi:MAG: Ig-like domain-containing protein [Burkholderiaceae bacterium]
MNASVVDRPLSRLLALVGSLFLALTLAACGGSGAGAGGSGVAATTKAASMTLLSSEGSLNSDGRTSATITAIVKNSQNVALANQTVSFSTTDPGATLEIGSLVTDATGRVTAKLTVDDQSVRDVSILARSGEIERTIAIPVVGNSLTISGSNNIVFNSPTDFSLSLRDSGGNPIAGKVVTISSVAGNTIQPAAPVTDALGQAAFTVTGVTEGPDTLTATAQGVTTAFSATVSGTQLSYATPARDAEVDVNTATPVTVTLIENGVPLNNQLVSFSATRGSFPGSSTATTNSSGQATVQIQSVSSGFATITATSPAGVTSSRRIEFVSRIPSKISVQPSPSVIGANLDVTGTNASQLIAVVKDSADNPVKGVRVDFSLVSDPSNGRIEPGFGITDSYGTATASFIAGPNPTGPGQVIIQSKVTSAPTITSNTSLTVSRLELSIEMGTGNNIESTNTDTTYKMPWIALVTDSSGNPVPNARVIVAIEPISYAKGQWIDAAGRWAQDVTVTCPNEDTNINKTLDAGEDINGNAQLDPGNQAAAVIESAGAVTDSNGIVEISVIYAQGAGKWTQMRLRVTITTASGATEGDADTTFWLPVLSADVASTDVAPPGADAPNSPYGTAAVCTDPN